MNQPYLALFLVFVGYSLLAAACDLQMTTKIACSSVPKINFNISRSRTWFFILASFIGIWMIWLWTSSKFPKFEFPRRLLNAVLASLQFPDQDRQIFQCSGAYGLSVGPDSVKSIWLCCSFSCQSVWSSRHWIQFKWIARLGCKEELNYSTCLSPPRMLLPIRFGLKFQFGCFASFIFQFNNRFASNIFGNSQLNWFSSNSLFWIS